VTTLRMMPRSSGRPNVQAAYIRATTL
jgi:hypothetical protein